ncbi:MAG: hypothetical protein KIC94_07650 [Clostridiales bacterium]|nr:hypothetical protein [Clostridiales bacterium]
MRKNLRFIMVCSLSVLVLQGCAKQSNDINGSNKSNQEVSDSNTNLDSEDNALDGVLESESEQNLQDKKLLLGLSDLYGKTEDKADELLGKGLIEKNEDGTIVNRTYEEVSLLGEKVQILVGYDNGTCFNITVTLNENDYNTYKDKMVALLGEGQQADGELVEEGSGVIRTSWTVNDQKISLLESYGVICIVVE